MTCRFAVVSPPYLLVGKLKGLVWNGTTNSLFIHTLTYIYQHTYIVYMFKNWKIFDVIKDNKQYVRLYNTIVLSNNNETQKAFY